MAAPEQDVFVYIIGPQVGPVKVGISHSPADRRGQLEAKSNEKLILMGQYPVGKERALAVERYAHWLLRDKSIGREWFNVTRVEAAQAIHDAIATDVHPKYRMPYIDAYPSELRGGDYLRTKVAPGVLARIHEASDGHHSVFIREAIQEKLDRVESELRRREPHPQDK